MDLVNKPNVSTPIQGSSSVVNDLYVYKASTFVHVGGGDGGGGKVIKVGAGK